MRTLDLGKHRRARIWMGELPDTSYPSKYICTQVIPAVKAQFTELRQGAVELFVPLGARFMYGLVGGQLEPNSASELRIVVDVASENERLLLNHISMSTDDVRIGIPAQYAQVITASTSWSIQESNVLAAGKLLINHGANSRVGSSPVIFKHLIIVLIKLLINMEPALSDEALLKLFPETYD